MWKEFIRRHSYHSKVAPNREGARLIIRRLQKTVLRILRDPDSNMSRWSFQQQQQPQQQPPPAPEPQADGAQYNNNQTQHNNNNNSNRGAKQDSNCRTCNDFKSWSKQQRLISNTQAAKEKHMANEKLNVSNAGGLAAPREDCPLDKVRLGISTWGLLHTMAAFYSDNPTDTEKRDMRTFFEVLSRLYPCEYCAKDFRTDIEVNPVNVNSQKDLALWLCKFHNRVNDKLGKPLFDCSKVNERWRDGWLDGSCD
ncbi:FAD-linked sulfhydryl oxidase ALR [Drosophila sulfurigaster albostrigata]|uniref:FAD-linked sulfhydryl oxidase ALR n=1 Tax=Drosophila sulfurigaster albostrigata TaxID=89887 RepID=UPI002D21E503|nr:FAD-linked sulfhydryl oxidase ALR [Drosophila sulfurigaster albostrigata]